MSTDRSLRLDGGASWPDPERAADLAWALRFSAPTRGDLLVAAGIIDAYLHIITHPAGTEAVIQQLRQARRIVLERRRERHGGSDV